MVKKQFYCWKVAKNYFKLFFGQQLNINKYWVYWIKQVILDLGQVKGTLPMNAYYGVRHAIIYNTKVLKPLWLQYRSIKI